MQGSIRSGANWLSYWMLRCLAHKRDWATEAQLDAAAEAQADVGDLEDSVRKARKVIARFRGQLPIDPGLSYLDMGCGQGGLAIALAKLGLRDVTGVDFVPRNVASASRRARKHGLADRVQFACADLRSWSSPRRYDVLLSFDALEHIGQPRAFLERMKAFIAPNGVAVLAFGPLFHSPFGDHMGPFFRVQIPWRGVLFPENAMLRVRREFFRSTDAASRYGDIAGGLNLMRYRQFLKWVDDTGWQFASLAVNTFLQPYPLLQCISDALMRTPVVQDYLAHNVYCVLRLRPETSR